MLVSLSVQPDGLEAGETHLDRHLEEVVEALCLRLCLLPVCSDINQSQESKRVKFGRTCAPTIRPVPPNQHSGLRSAQDVSDSPKLRMNRASVPHPGTFAWPERYRLA